MTISKTDLFLLIIAAGVWAFLLFGENWIS